LIIDDNIGFLNDVEYLLKNRFKVIKASTSQKGIEILKENRVAIVLLDLQLPDIQGLDVLNIIRNEIDPYLPVIIITEFDNTDNVVKAMKSGAYDFLSKDFNVELLFAKIEKALKHRSLELEVDAMQSNMTIRRDKFVFVSEAMKKVNLEITRLSRLEFDVLLTGETGAGKDMVASQIHLKGERKEKPFLSVSLKSLSESVVESELFGHEKGSFTGANQLKIGVFEAANGGIIYIPEISCLNETMQLKLLNFMQYKTITRVGQDARKGEIVLDVRLIMATNENMEKLIETGRIREDFYYRIAGVKLNIPPLRERKEDILPLAKYFLDKYSIFFHDREFEFSDSLIKALEKYQWPGNVRELSNSIKNALVYTDNKILDLKDFPNLLNKPSTAHHAQYLFDTPDGCFKDFNSAEKEFRKSYYTALLKKAGNKISAGAKLSGLTPQGIRKALKQLGMDF